MSYYNICPHCGAFLDPGERCDCETETKEEPKKAYKQRADERTRRQHHNERGRQWQALNLN